MPVEAAGEDLTEPLPITAALGDLVAAVAAGTALVKTDLMRHLAPAVAVVEAEV